MPIHIEQVLAKEAHWNAEVQRLRKQLAAAEEQANRFRNCADVCQEIEEAGSQQETDGPASPTAAASDTADGRPKFRRIMDMALDLLKAAGRPIPTGDLLAQMEQRGLDVGGQNHVSTLSSYLSRDKKQQVISSRLGWRLVEWGDDTPPSVHPKRQRRPRNSHQTKKAPQDQQDRTAV